MYIHAKASEFLEPTGIHFHIGSQLTSLSPIIDAAKIVSELLRELRALEIDTNFLMLVADLASSITMKKR